MKNKRIGSIIILFTCMINFSCFKSSLYPQYSKPEIMNIRRAALIPSGKVPNYILDKLFVSIGKKAKFRIVQRASVDKLLDEMNLQRNRVVSAKNAQKVGSKLGVDGVILVSYSREIVYRNVYDTSRIPEYYSISLNTKLIEVETELILWQARRHKECLPDDFSQTLDELCNEISDTLYKFESSE